MPNYQNGKIYTIRNYNDNNMIYVGSTTQQLAKRFYGHKHDSIKHPNWKLYQTVNNNWNKWYIELYELFPCNSKIELEKKEGEVIRLIGTLNNNIAGQNIKENLVEYHKKYDKQYREDNAEKRKEKTKCPCGGHYLHRNKSQHFKTKLHQDYELNIAGTDITTDTTDITIPNSH